MARYLINKTSALGDIAQCLAVAQYLKERDRKCQIDWVVERSGSLLVKRHPDVDQVIEIAWQSWRKSLWKRSTLKQLAAAIATLRSKRYQAVFDLQGNLKSGLINCLVRAEKKVGFHQSCLREKINAWTTNRRFICENLPMPQRYLDLVRAHFEDSSPHIVKPIFLQLCSKERSQVHSLAEFSNPERLQKIGHFLICPFSAWPSKHLGSDQLSMLIDYLDRRFKATIWLASGSLDEEKAAERICWEKKKSCRLLPRLSLPQLQYFMRFCSAIFAMDSLPLHLAQTAQIATFGFFGPSQYRAYSPDQGSTYGVEGQVGGHYQGTCPYDQNFHLRCRYMRSCSGPCLKTQSEREFLPAIVDFADRLDRRS